MMGPLEAREFGGSGGRIPYRIALPEGCGERLPMIIFLHGVGERGKDNAAQVKLGVPAILEWCKQSATPAVVVAPQCPEDQMWAGIAPDWSGVTRGEAPPAAQRLVVELVRHLAEELPVDPDRIYLTGLSMGGFGVWEMLRREPGLFAAAVPICGGGVPGDAPVLRAVPIWVFHGARDDLVPVEVSRAMVGALEEAGGSVRYTEFPEAKHDAWTETYGNPEVFEWLFAQSRRRRPAG